MWMDFDDDGDQDADEDEEGNGVVNGNIDRWPVGLNSIEMEGASLPNFGYPCQPFHLTAPVHVGIRDPTDDSKQHKI